MIKLEGLEVYPAMSLVSYRITEDFKKALKEAGDFELYFGIHETEDKYDEIDFRWRPLYYSIQMKGKNIGYTGFHGYDNSLEPEIYIFNMDWNESAPHGSGRKYKREDVKNNFKVSAFKAEMKGIYSTCIGAGTLDEAPFVYRDINSILDSINDTVDVTEILKPLYNYKAGDQ